MPSGWTIAASWMFPGDFAQWEIDWTKVRPFGWSMEDRPSTMVRNGWKMMFMICTRVVFIWWRSWCLQISWDGFCFGFMLKHVVSKTHLVMACAWLAAQTLWSISVDSPGWNLSFLMSRYCVWLAARRRQLACFGAPWRNRRSSELAFCVKPLHWCCQVPTPWWWRGGGTHFFGRDRGVWLCPAKSVGLLGIGARLWPMEMTFRKACSTRCAGCEMAGCWFELWIEDLLHNATTQGLETDQLKSHG